MSPAVESFRLGGDWRVILPCARPSFDQRIVGLFAPKSATNSHRMSFTPFHPLPCYFFLFFFFCNVSPPVVIFFRSTPPTTSHPPPPSPRMVIRLRMNGAGLFQQMASFPKVKCLSLGAGEIRNYAREPARTHTHEYEEKKKRNTWPSVAG